MALAIMAMNASDAAKKDIQRNCPTAKSGCLFACHYATCLYFRSSDRKTYFNVMHFKRFLLIVDHPDYSFFCIVNTVVFRKCSNERFIGNG